MFLHSVCCCSWRCHCTFCCFVVFVNFFSSVSTTVFLDSCGQIICPASCIMLGMFFFLSQVKMQTFPNLHTNLFKCSRHTFLKEGLRGFYSGTLPGVLSALLFFSSDFCKSMNFILFQLLSQSLLRTPCCSWPTEQHKGWFPGWLGFKKKSLVSLATVSQVALKYIYRFNCQSLIFILAGGLKNIVNS